MIPTDTYKILTFTVTKVPAATFAAALRELFNDEKKNWKFFKNPLDMNSGLRTSCASPWRRAFAENCHHTEPQRMSLRGVY